MILEHTILTITKGMNRYRIVFWGESHPSQLPVSVAFETNNRKVKTIWIMVSLELPAEKWLNVTVLQYIVITCVILILIIYYIASKPTIF